MSDEDVNQGSQTSLTKVLAITALPLLSCVGLAWLLAKFSGVSFPFLLLVFCAIGYFLFLKDMPDFVAPPTTRKPKRRMTKAEIEAARAKRFYIGQDKDDSAQTPKTAERPRDVTQPVNIMDASKLTNKKSSAPAEQVPDGSEGLTRSPERQEKKLNPERDLALKPDDL